VIRGLDRGPADLAARDPPSVQNTKTCGFFRAGFCSFDGRHNFRSLLCDLRVTSLSYMRGEGLQLSSCDGVSDCISMSFRVIRLLEVNGQRTDSMGLSGYCSGICQVLG